MVGNSCGRLKNAVFAAKRTSEPEIPSYLSFRCPFYFSYVFLFLYLHASWTYMGGEYHLGTGLAELLELAEEAIELHCALEGNLHDHGVFSGNAAAL